MEHIKITLPEVSNLASQIRLINEEMYDVLVNAEKLMEELNGVWISDGASTIFMRFKNFTRRFTEEKETIETYARFLDHTVSSYDSLETTIEANASSFN